MMHRHSAGGVPTGEPYRSPRGTDHPPIGDPPRLPEERREPPVPHQPPVGEPPPPHEPEDPPLDRRPPEGDPPWPATPPVGDPPSTGGAIRLGGLAAFVDCSAAASTCAMSIVVMHSEGRVPRGQASITPQGEHQRSERTTVCRSGGPQGAKRW